MAMPPTESAFSSTKQEDLEQPMLAAPTGGKLPPLAKFIDVDPHRPEAAALLTAMVVVRRLFDENSPENETEPAARVQYCLDNKSVTDDLKWTFGTHTSVYDYLKPDYDILQAINGERAVTLEEEELIQPNVSWVKGHQDDHKPLEELSGPALANCYADKICDIMHSATDNEAGRFPEWIPNLPAGLLHQGQLVTKTQESHVITVTTAPALQESVMSDSKKRGPVIEEQWTEATFNCVDWQANQSSFKALSPGKKIQIAKFAHEWTPTLHHRANVDNKIDRQCFACGNLKENVTHMLRCKSDPRKAARTKALYEMRNHFARHHTPAPMAALIIDSLEAWYDGHRPTISLLPTDDDDPNATLHRLINEAYYDQCTIGWGHFLRGSIAKTWKRAIAHYYYERRPGRKFTPTLWARKTADQIWTTFRTIWLCRNGELYGKDYDEERAIALRTTRQAVREIYEDSKELVSERDSSILHAQPINEVLKWTKRHLDAYLATAEVYLEQNVDPA